MEKKLTIHKNQASALTPSVSWNPPFTATPFWGPVNFEPLWRGSDIFAETHRNMAQIIDGFFGSLPALRAQPYADIAEDQKSLRIKMDVPGLESEDIDISTEGGMLTISGDKHEGENGTESRYSFSYSTSLPENAHVDQANVRFANHRLSIEIPKHNGAAPKVVSHAPVHKKQKRKKARH